MSSKLNKAQIAEIKDLYVKDDYGSVRELAKLFKVGLTAIKWTVDYKDFKKKQLRLVKKWKKEHPEQWNVISRKAVDKWQKNNKDKMRKRCQLYYLKNRTKIRQQHKKYYLKNRKRIRQQTKKYYLKNRKKISQQHKKYYLKNKKKNDDF